jgi:hypothetical protein
MERSVWSSWQLGPISAKSVSYHALEQSLAGAYAVSNYFGANPVHTRFSRSG